MIVSPRGLLRGAADARLQAEVLEWLNDQPRDRWHTLSEGWLDRKTDSGRSMWRPTASLPIVTRRAREERLSWSDYFSSILELPVR